MNPAELQENRRARLLVCFLILSAILHALFLLTLVVFPKFPTPAFAPKPVAPTKLILHSAPPPKHHTELVTTQPDPGAQHNPLAPTESDNDTRLATQSRRNRDPLAIQPDLQGHPHTRDLNDSTYSPAKPLPVAPPAPTKNQTTTQAQKPQPNTPHPPRPPQPAPPTTVVETIPPLPRVVQATPAPKPKVAPVRAKPVQLIDPNGLPVLPPIAANTILPPDPAVEAVRGGAPPPSESSVRGEVLGSTGIFDHTSPESRRTELGTYMAKVKRAIGSIWYPKVQNQLQLVSVGVVHIRITIFADGRVDATPVGNHNDSDEAMILRSISLNSIKEAAPFDPFPESLKLQFGDSYSDVFSFQIYSD